MMVLVADAQEHYPTVHIRHLRRVFIELMVVRECLMEAVEIKASPVMSERDDVPVFLLKIKTEEILHTLWSIPDPDVLCEMMIPGDEEWREMLPMPFTFQPLQWYTKTFFRVEPSVRLNIKDSDVLQASLARERF